VQAMALCRALTGCCILGANFGAMSMFHYIPILTIRYRLLLNLSMPIAGKIYGRTSNLTTSPLTISSYRIGIGTFFLYNHLESERAFVEQQFYLTFYECRTGISRWHNLTKSPDRYHLYPSRINISILKVSPFKEYLRMPGTSLAVLKALSTANQKQESLDSPWLLLPSADIRPCASSTNYRASSGR
jgi:hypothetical protein